MPSQLDLRPSPIAGQWYPGDPNRLRSSVDAYLDAAAEPALNGRILALVTPHAGHRYSGPVAGHAFALLRGLSPELVAVVAPMHYLSPYALITTAHDGFVTPLGPIPVDRDALHALNKLLEAELGIGLVAVRNDPEHALEIELPFLQRALHSEFKLLPVMVRDPSERVARGLGKALAEVMANRNTVMVASTDLSHFYPQAVANQLDSEMLHQVEALDPAGVLKTEEEGRGFACGRGALAAVLWAALEMGADRAQVLNYATSGDVTGDYSQVVGYGAAVIYQQEQT